MTTILSSLADYSRRERTRFLRFMVVGAIGAVVDFGISNLLVYFFSAPLVLAGTISFIAAILSNFIWNRYWTYPDSRSKPISQQLIQFSFINSLGLLIRVPILWLMEPVFLWLVNRLPVLSRLSLRLPFMSPSTLAANLTLATAVIVVMFWNFFANRYWTYSDVK
jgi:putative flippase GtrA